MADQFVFPELPSESRVELVVSTALTFAKLLSGAGIGIGALLTTMPQEKMSAIATLALFGFSVVGAVASWIGSRWQHRNIAVANNNAVVSSAVASASLSAVSGVPTPVAVQVTPAGQPDITIPLVAK